MSQEANAVDDFQWKAPPPNWSALKGEMAAERAKRIRAEEDTFLHAYQPTAAADNVSDDDDDPTGIYAALDQLENKALGEEDEALFKFKNHKVKNLRNRVQAMRYGQPFDDYSDSIAPKLKPVAPDTEGNTDAIEFRFKAPPPNWDQLDKEDKSEWWDRMEAEEYTFVKAYDPETWPTAERERCLEFANFQGDWTGIWAAIDRVEALMNASINTGASQETAELKTKRLKSLIGLASSKYAPYEDPRAKLKSEAVPKDPPHPAVRALQMLYEGSNYGKYYASNISEQLAKAWANSEHTPTFRQLDLVADEHYPLWEERQNELTATGITIQAGMNAFKGCYQDLKNLDSTLVDTVTAQQAIGIYDAYDRALDQYWQYIDNINKALHTGKVKSYIGSPYKTMLQDQLKLFEVVGQKIVTVVGPKLDPSVPRPEPRGALDMRPRLSYLDKPQTIEKLQEWKARTIERLNDGLAAY